MSVNVKIKKISPAPGWYPWYKHFIGEIFRCVHDETQKVYLVEKPSSEYQFQLLIAPEESEIVEDLNGQKTKNADAYHFQALTWQERQEAKN